MEIMNAEHEKKMKKAFNEIWGEHDHLDED